MILADSRGFCKVRQERSRRVPVRLQHVVLARRGLLLDRQRVEAPHPHLEPRRRRTVLSPVSTLPRAGKPARPSLRAEGGDLCGDRQLCLVRSCSGPHSHGQLLPGPHARLGTPGRISLRLYRRTAARPEGHSGRLARLCVDPRSHLPVQRRRPVSLALRGSAGNRDGADPGLCPAGIGRRPRAGATPRSSASG